MIQVHENVEAVCTIDGDNELYYIRLDIVHCGTRIMSLKFAEITNEVNELLLLNEDVGLFATADELKTDLAKNNLKKFLGENTVNSKITLLFAIRAKIKHQEQKCAIDCIYCNPDLGEDPFPDFTINAELLEPKGHA